MVQKKPTKILDVDVDNIVISKLIEKNNNFQHLIGCLDDFIRPLVLIIRKISGYIKTFKDEINILMPFVIDDNRLSEKY